ncbi:MAG: AI-2E family transporter [Tepidisphaeraceae bacterium]
MEVAANKPRLSIRLFGGAVLTVACLYWGRDLFIPIALAVLVSFLLAPAVEWLVRRHVPNGLAVGVVTSFAGLLCVGVLILVSMQVVDLATKLPDYKDNLVTKLRALRQTTGSMKQITATVNELQHELATPTTEPTTAPATVPAKVSTGSGVVPVPTAPPTIAVREPVLVKQVEAGPDMLALVNSTVTPIVAPLATAGMVYVLVLFLLLDRKLVVRRLRLLGRVMHFDVAGEAIDDAAHRVGRYLLMQLIVNACYGAMVALAMWAVGLPNALLWGFIATLLRYIPYIGPVLAATLPILLSVAVFPDWKRPLIVTGCFVVAETCTNMVLEPLLYGKGTGVSTIGVVLATFFWGWLWDGIGLVLAMPITVLLVVVGRHIGALATLAHMLSSEEPMTTAIPTDAPGEASASAKAEVSLPASGVAPAQP